MEPTKQPRHGESREHHFEDERGNHVHVFAVAAVQSVCETYCAGCNEWLKTEGVVGQLRFMAEHGDHG